MRGCCGAGEGRRTEAQVASIKAHHCRSRGGRAQVVGGNARGGEVRGKDLEEVQEVDLLLVVIEPRCHGGGVDDSHVDSVVLHLGGKGGRKG